MNTKHPLSGCSFGILVAADHYGATPVVLQDIDKQHKHPSALGMAQIASQIETALL